MIELLVISIISYAICPLVMALSLSIMHVKTNRHQRIAILLCAPISIPLLLTATILYGLCEVYCDVIEGDKPN